jgi:hypothetical protein
MTGRLYCTPGALWKLNWFLRGFGYDSELQASLSPDCSWYQSDSSRMSATAASLRTIRGLFTGVESVHEAC